jgi:hypothetical protein
LNHIYPKWIYDKLYSKPKMGSPESRQTFWGADTGNLDTAEVEAEAVHRYMMKALWSNDGLHLYKGSFSAKKSGHMS